MTAIRALTVEKLWRGQDPFKGLVISEDRLDFQGWASENPLLNRSINEIRPSTIVEVGVWKGGSVITMAKELKRLGLDAVVIAVDTWLGAAEHWYNEDYFPSLRIENGYPTLYKTFCANIIAQGLDDYVLPLPIDSINAAFILRRQEIKPHVIHIDGGHDFNSVLSDLRVWWPLLEEGGILIGDDYHPTGIDVWPEVREAFHCFFKTKALENFEGKCVVRKLANSA